jgi:NAD(P) transhydrogenase subunit beta
VVGACDVVNPAAIRTEGTPISGMPILNVHEAKGVAVFNFDPKPGYSGVPNPLYDDPKAMLMFGDAKVTVARFSEGVAGKVPAQAAAQPAAAASAGSPVDRAVAAAKAAKRVIFIPGYGMAVAQAQFEVVKLAKQLEADGKEVLFAIHPVAGRMPGHMNVLLAEAEADYGLLKEMDEVNPLFPETDLAIVVGACDVVNPAAIRTEGTPISGMPILNVHEAKGVAVFNFDPKPGYSGVPNPLYDDPKAILFFGDAGKTVAEVRNLLGVK